MSSSVDPTDDDDSARSDDDDAVDDDDSSGRSCSLAGPCDLDGDGVESVACGGDDCDDSDPAISPALYDLPDGRDNDCDAEVDEVEVPGSWVHLPRGAFLMGCGRGEQWCAGFAGGFLWPHEVCVDAMWLTRTEVTVGEYQVCQDAGVCGPPTTAPQPEVDACAHAESQGATLPMDCVGWSQAMQYCGWLGGSLPTEAEWERAARGPLGSTFPWGEEEPDCSWTVMREGISTDPADDGCGRGRTWPADEMVADRSGFGLLGMGGNVTEMVLDSYNSDAYRGHRYLNPVNLVPEPASTAGPVLRGGNAAGSHIPEGQFNSFFNGWRSWLPEGSLGEPRIGFRCSRDSGPRR